MPSFTPAFELTEEEIQRKKKALKARRKLKEMTLHQLMPSSQQRQGAMEKAEHLAGLTAEGVSGEILINLFIFAFELSFNTPWWIQTIQFQEALAKELESISNGEPQRLTYLPDDNGVFPEIYPVIGEGKVDFSKAPLLPSEITPYAIRANGYVPQPAMTESLFIVFDFHYERMSGASSLNAEQKARMYNVIGDMKSDSKNESDSENRLRSDNASINAMRPLPKPRAV